MYSITETIAEQTDTFLKQKFSYDLDE